jgi:PEGA domain
MSNRSAVVTMILVLSCGLSLAQSAGAQTVPTSPQPDAERARVFITDSESWEMSGASGGSSGGFAGETHGGARPQTAEIVKTFGERCPSVVTNNIQSKTDYVVVLDHEGGKGLLRHRNKVAVFNRESGDSIVSKSTLSLGGSVQDACEAITKDWTAHGKDIRAAEQAATAAQQRPVVAVPIVQEVAKPSTTKLSIASNPGSADIEVDGNFVGNTPSTVELEAGDHVVKVSKSGYKAWERKLKASGGSVNINAELEAEAK